MSEACGSGYDCGYLVPCPRHDVVNIIPPNDQRVLDKELKNYVNQGTKT